MYRTLMSSFACCMFILGLAACGTQTSTSDSQSTQPLQLNTEQANQLFDDIFLDILQYYPEYQTALGIKDNNDQWNDYSEAFAEQMQAIRQQHLATLEGVDPSLLDSPTLLSLNLYQRELRETIAAHRWRHHDYPVNQMFGLHSSIPSLLINFHTINNEKDAEDYISRLQKIDRVIAQLMTGLQLRADKKVIAPRFVFAHVIRDCENLLQGAPFDGESDSTLSADFKTKLETLDMPAARQAALLADAKAALLSSVEPAYQRLIRYLKELEEQTVGNHGVWALPEGTEFYRHQLKRITTTGMTAEQIHQLGLQGVAEIHAEMHKIIRQVGFDGDLQAFFAFMRDDPQFYFPETEAGRAEYLTRTGEIIAQMEARLPDVFMTLPQAELTVKRVEAYREKSAGKAFYSRPAPDGSRPGIYFANLYKMSDMPSYQMEALAYHEALPGHHMQLSIAQELTGLPKFRRYGGHTAYTEGWGLYAERLPREMGFYQDPYSDFGRLAMALWRACRLVVDTGLHAKQWSKAQAIQYLEDNTPNPSNDIERAIERYMVMPGQATAYYVGMTELLILRARAKQALGDAFDIREFHDVVLANGSLPLDVLSAEVDSWIAGKR